MATMGKTKKMAEIQRGPQMRHLSLVIGGLEARVRGCVLCLAVFPEGAVIKKRLLIHWWIGEGFVESAGAGKKRFDELVAKGFVIPVPSALCSTVHRCKVRPWMRDLLVGVARSNGFFETCIYKPSTPAPLPPPCRRHSPRASSPARRGRDPGGSSRSMAAPAAMRFAAVAREAPAACRLGARERDPCPPRGAAGARMGAQCWARRGLALRCQSGAAAATTTTTTLKKGDAPAPAVSDAAAAAARFTVVMKFGGSSVASAERMREVADLILSFPEEAPVVVLSAMGKTTNNLLLAGEKAVSCGAPKASEIDELKAIKELHLRTIDELGLDSSIVSGMEIMCGHYFRKGWK